MDEFYEWGDGPMKRLLSSQHRKRESPDSLGDIKEGVD